MGKEAGNLAGGYEVTEVCVQYEWEIGLKLETGSQGCISMMGRRPRKLLRASCMLTDGSESQGQVGSPTIIPVTR